MKRQMRKAMKRFMAAVMVAGMLLTVPGTVSNEEGIVTSGDEIDVDEMY